MFVSKETETHCPNEKSNSMSPDTLAVEIKITPNEWHHLFFPRN